VVLNNNNEDISDMVDDTVQGEAPAEDFLEEVLRVLSEGGYDVARIYINEKAGPEKRDGLFRILAMCQECNLTPDFAAEVFRNINKEDLGLV
jgi:hypothetical protein